MVIAALVAAGLFIAMRGRVDMLGSVPQISPAVASAHNTPKPRETSGGTRALLPLASAEVVTRPFPSDRLRGAAATSEGEVSVGLKADANPNLNEVFQVDLNVDARRPASRFSMTVNYDPLMLRLVGVRSSEFVVRPTDIAEFNVRIPEDAAGQVVISWDGRSIWGAGVLGHVEFELYAAGSTEISVSEIEVVDAEGRGVRAAVPEPVRIERHSS